VASRWFSPGIPVSSTNKTDRRITEILLKVALNSIDQTKHPLYLCLQQFGNSLLLFRYLVDTKWFKQWKKYVGYESSDVFNVGQSEVYPGPVDNSPLIEGNG
jgi:hypothetical protein